MRKLLVISMAVSLGLFVADASWSQKSSAAAAHPATATQPCGRFQIIAGEYDFGTITIHTTIMLDTETGRTWQLRTLFSDDSKKSLTTGWEPLGEVRAVPLGYPSTPQP